MSLFDALSMSMIRAFPPELAHTITVQALKSGLVGKGRPATDDPILATRLPVSGLELNNPVGLAAGFDKNADVFRQMLNYGFGFVECGTVTPRSQPGNPKPRLFRLREDRAVINRMGFNNEGLAPFVQKLAQRTHTGPVGANVGANKTSQGADRIADYVAGLKAVWPSCDYITINISSPNTPGLRELQEKGALEGLLREIADAAQALRMEHGARPVFLKIAPDFDAEAMLSEDKVSAIVETVLAVGEVTGLIVSNTTVSRPAGLQSAHKGEGGGLSGAPLFDMSTQVLAMVAKAAAGRLDIIGVGGVSDAETAYAKIRAGAHAVQLYSALVYSGMSLIPEIKQGLVERLKRDGFGAVGDAVGSRLV